MLEIQNKTPILAVFNSDAPTLIEVKASTGASDAVVSGEFSRDTYAALYYETDEIDLLAIKQNVAAFTLVTPLARIDMMDAPVSDPLFSHFPRALISAFELTLH